MTSSWFLFSAHMKRCKDKHTWSLYVQFDLVFKVLNFRRISRSVSCYDWCLATQSWCRSSAEAHEQFSLKTMINVNSICTTQWTLTASVMKIKNFCCIGKWMFVPRTEQYSLTIWRREIGIFIVKTNNNYNKCTKN